MKSQGQLMKRDIVQFVPFNKFKDCHPSTLAKEVLEEIPTQVTEFMSMYDIKPMPRKIQANNNELSVSKQSSMYEFDNPVPSMPVIPPNVSTTMASAANGMPKHKFTQNILA